MRIAEKDTVGLLADELDALAFEHEAAAAKLHAEASRRRVAEAKTKASSVAWIDVATLPTARKRALAACRSGELPATKQGRKWVARSVDAEAWLAKASPSAGAANDDDSEENAVRRRLGLVGR